MVSYLNREFSTAMLGQLVCRGLGMQCGALLNGAIHWLNSCFERVDGRLSKVFCIYAFDLASEVLRQMPVPGFNRDDEDNYHFVGEYMQPVVNLGGCLCLVSRSVYFFKENCDIGLWMMTDYGVSDSWMKVFEFSENDLPYVSASEPSHISWNSDMSFITESGAIVIKWFQKKLVKIECRTPEKLVCSSPYMLEDCPQGQFLLDTIVYDETLVSVPQ